MSLSKAGLIVGLILLMGVWSTLLARFLGAKIQVKRPFFMISRVLVGLAGFGTFALDNQLLIYASVAVMWAAMFVIASFFSVIAPIGLGVMWPDAFGSYVPSFIVWAIFSWGLLVSGFLLPEPNSQAHPHQGASTSLEYGRDSFG